MTQRPSADLSANGTGELDDGALASRLAAAAGDVLVAIRDASLCSGKTLGRLGDAVAQELLSRGLADHRPADAVLSEEAKDDTKRLQASRVWIIDPLDGTREYSEGREDWAVHVALTIAGTPHAAAVALPGIGEMFTTEHPTDLPPAGDGPPRIAVSRTRPPAQAELVATRLGAELRPIGSAGFKTMAILRGEVDAYLHAGGQYEWDSAAPAGVALAAGLHASRIDGSPLIYNQADPLLPDLLICRPELAAQLLQAVAS